MGKDRKKLPFKEKQPPFKRAILEHVSGLQKEVISIKRDMKKEAAEIIDKEMKSRLSLVELALREVRLFCEILVEKGIATQEEISQKRDKIRKENG